MGYGGGGVRWVGKLEKRLIEQWYKGKLTYHRGIWKNEDTGRDRE